MTSAFFYGMLIHHRDPEASDEQRCQPPAGLPCFITVCPISYLVHPSDVFFPSITTLLRVIQNYNSHMLKYATPPPRLLRTAEGKLGLTVFTRLVRVDENEMYAIPWAICSEIMATLMSRHTHVYIIGH
jgi:hypothetical protein